VESRVVLRRDDIAHAEALARVTHEKWRQARGHYPDTFANHRTGRLGELGVELWASRQRDVDVDPVFRDPDREHEADFRLNSLRVEVKTWWSRNWEALGRCIRPTQLRFVRAKADAVLWVTLEQACGEVAVSLAGWSTVNDVAIHPVTITGPPHLRLENHQLPVNEMRALDDLVDAAVGRCVRAQQLRLFS
jgi:hypothetical protein